MAWLLKNDADNAIIEEIERQTDRGAALIATAYVEERLLDAIKARTNRNEDIENKIYKGSGPLASLSAKVDLGLLIGIYDLHTHKLFHAIREIRNEFAHEPKPRDFQYQRIKDICQNINISGHARITAPDGQQFDMDLKQDGTARTAFMNAIKFLLLCLDMEIKTLPPRQPAPPVVQAYGPSPEKP